MSDDGRLLGNDTDGEVDDVSTTTEGGGGSVG
jgi:hypothetical protein